MIVLTGVIAYSAWSQARAAKKQAKYARQQADEFRKAEQRLRKKDEPKVKFTMCGYDICASGESGDDSRVFFGFAITNASYFDITITTVAFELGIPAKNNKRFTSESVLTPVTKCQGRDISSRVSFPRTLKYGESISFLYDLNSLERAMDTHDADGKKYRTRLRPRCFDSLGNVHKANAWIEWEKRKTSYFNDPGPGLITEDERWGRIECRP